MRLLLCVLPLMLACSDDAPPVSSVPTAQAPTAATPPSRGPNVLFVSLDTVSAEHMALYGGPAKMPNLEAVAAAGTTFDHAISHFPETALSHWSMMTGALPAVHGNVPAYGNSRFTGPTLAERLRASGMRTAAFIGGETLTDRSTGMSRGFEIYDDAYPWDRKDLRRPAAEVVAAATTWMSEQHRSNQPYFAFVHLFDAHFPYTPAPPWDTAYTQGYTGTLTGSDEDLRPYRDGQKTPSAADIAHIAGLYQGELSEMDAALKPLFEHESMANTIVVVTSDHGESFRHDYWFNHRGGLWDEITRVPLVIRGPDLPEGERRDGVVGLVDLSPTLLGRLELAPLDGVHGMDLGPTLKGAEGQDRVAFSITDPARPNPQFAARSHDHKLIAPAADGMPVLDRALSYDLRVDPLEAKPDAPLPEPMESIGSVYQAKLQRVMARWQGPAPERRQPEQAEIERLKALGYVDEPGAEQPRPAPGPPPRP